MSTSQKTSFDELVDLCLPGPSGGQRKLPTSKESFQQPEKKYYYTPYCQSEEILMTIINDAMIRLLAYSRKQIPFKHSDILNNNKAISGRSDMDIMVDIKKKLLYMYGLKLIVLEYHKYIVVNPRMKHIDPSKLGIKPRKTELLHFFLAIILINNRKAYEGNFRACLQKKYVDFQDNHAYFGNVNKHLKEFQDQLYIVKSYDPSTDGVALTEPYYIWGVRARHEVSKKSIMDLLCKIFDSDEEKLPPWVLNIVEAVYEPKAKGGLT